MALYGGPPRGGLKSLNLGELESEITNEEDLEQLYTETEQLNAELSIRESGEEENVDEALEEVTENNEEENGERDLLNESDENLNMEVQQQAIFNCGVCELNNLPLQ